MPNFKQKLLVPESGRLTNIDIEDAKYFFSVLHELGYMNVQKEPFDKFSSRKIIVWDGNCKTVYSANKQLGNSNSYLNTKYPYIKFNDYFELLPNKKKSESELIEPVKYWQEYNN